MRFLKSLDKAVEKFVRISTVMAFLMLFVLVVYTVGARFLHWNALAWLDDIVDLLMLWLVYIGAQIVYRQNGHVAVFLVRGIVERKSPKFGIVLGVINNLLVLTFLGCFFIALIIYTVNVAAPASLARVPLSKAYWMTPVFLGFLLMIGYTLRFLIGTARKEGCREA